MSLDRICSLWQKGGREGTKSFALQASALLNAQIAKGFGARLLLFPSSSLHRKVVHELCDAMELQHVTLSKPFKVVAYAPQCTVGCCGAEYFTFFPIAVRVTAASKPFDLSAALAKKGEKKKIGATRTNSRVDGPLAVTSNDECMWYALPQTALMVVLSQFKTLRDVASVLRVNKTWHRLGDQPTVWRALYMRHVEMLEEKGGKKKQQHKMTSSSSSSSSSWKQMLKDEVSNDTCPCSPLKHLHEFRNYRTQLASPEGTQFALNAGCFRDYTEDVEVSFYNIFNDEADPMLEIAK